MQSAQGGRPDISELKGDNMQMRTAGTLVYMDEKILLR